MIFSSQLNYRDACAGLSGDIDMAMAGVEKKEELRISGRAVEYVEALKHELALVLLDESTAVAQSQGRSLATEEDVSAALPKALERLAGSAGEILSTV